jgi:hypothetical protein
MAKSIARGMAAFDSMGMSKKQMAFVLGVLRLDAAPALPDPIPAACKHLPLKPPSRSRTGTDD